MRPSRTSARAPVTDFVLTRNWRRNLLLAIAVVAGMQFVPWRRPTNPIAGAEPAWDSARTRALFVRACADCHSHDTRWPWYSHVAPVSWYVVGHVEKARHALNVSRWSDAMAEAGAEADDEIRRGSMPLPSYLRLHPQARLAADEKAALGRGLATTFRPTFGFELQP
jgi:mono/diheme cytochrome c family protein